jgi:DMSO/TMAO reductase YedYZ molybdopterin-dependent catalytic subunit
METRDDIGTPVGRRVILAMLGLGAAGVAFGSSVQRVLARLGTPSFLPGADRFRIYSVVGFLPERSAEAYRLTVTGLVTRPLTLTLADLQAMPSVRLVKDFQCVTGWRVSSVPWTGVKLADVLDAAGVRPEGQAITFKSFDGAYSESLSMAQARRDDVIVAYAMEDKPVTAEHGGPVRMYVAPMYGYKSTKWLSAIQVVGAVEPGYWEIRGYDVDGWVGKSNGRSDQPTS